MYDIDVENMEKICHNTIEKKSAAFLTLGCKVNSYETNAMKKLFTEAGYEIKEFEDTADVYIVNTCTVTNMADRKSRQMLHKAKKKNPNGIIVAAGCYVQASQEKAEEDSSIDIIVGNNQKKDIVSIVEAYAKGDRNYNLLNMNEEQKYEELYIENAGEKTRAYIKIQDGCNQFCSYCIIPHVRGRIRSRGEEEILKEMERIVEHGYKEVVLTGIHLSSYGVDLHGEKNFTVLEGKPLLSMIQKISKIDGIERIRLGSLEPRIITEAFVKQLSAIHKVCPHFHLSLQSGCDATLKRMNRKYTTKEYEESCEILRKYYDRPAITTDIIVGFPEETDEEFSETKKFVQKIRFSDVHIFKYSMRKGTLAAKMKGQIAEETKHHRSIELIEIGKELTRKYESDFLGEQTYVLVEETVELDGTSYETGHNERYMKLLIPVETEGCKGEICRVEMKQVLEDGTIICNYI